VCSAAILDAIFDSNVVPLFRNGNMHFHKLHTKPVVLIYRNPCLQTQTGMVLDFLSYLQYYRVRVNVKCAFTYFLRVSSVNLRRSSRLVSLSCKYMTDHFQYLNLLFTSADGNVS